MVEGQKVSCDIAASLWTAGRATVTGGSPQPQRAGARRDTFLERIRRAASQPALARPGGPNLSRLADAAIESLSDLPTSEAGYAVCMLPIGGALQKCFYAYTILKNVNSLSYKWCAHKKWCGIFFGISAQTPCI